MAQKAKFERVSFTGCEGNTIAGDVWGGGAGPVAVLLHGAGQTRHSWSGSAGKLVDAGWRVVTIDQRGHGESDWSPAGHYSLDEFAGDASEVLRQTADRFGEMPVAVGASLGGLSSLMVAGGAHGKSPISALALVDITPRLNPNGVDGILSFMGARMHAGFSSLDEAADAIAEYRPHRPRPRSLEGLRRNLRLDQDGRYRWHWDPRFIKGPRPISGPDRVPLEEAARRTTVPTLLVRGGLSELVDEEHAREFQELVPHAVVADVSGAGHMVTSDRNDVFAEVVTEFLGRYVDR